MQEFVLDATEGFQRYRFYIFPNLVHIMSLFTQQLDNHNKHLFKKIYIKDRSQTSFVPNVIL